MPRNFDPASEIPDLSGKTILITGGNSGLGAATAVAIAAHKPAHIYLTVRTPSSAVPTVEAINKQFPDVNLSVIELDLASLESVKSGAARFNAEATRLDILFLNAGVAALPPGLSKDGYEIQFATNHLGHALLTQLLMPVLLRTAKEPGADVRVVSVSSMGHKGFSQEFNFASLKTDMQDTSPIKLYGQSKLGNILFAKSLAQYYPQLTTSSLHPGTVKTEIWGKAGGHPILRRLMWPAIAFFGVTSEEGAKNQLWCSTSSDVKSGTYYEPIGNAGKESSQGKSDDLAEKLWEWTENELKRHNGPGWIKAVL